MQNILPQKTSVVIIGAGTTGLTAANLLGQAGIATIVIERNEQTCLFPRAASIDDEGLRVLQAIGLLEEVLAHARIAVKAHYISQSRILAKVAPKTYRNGFPLISTFHQPTLEHTLLEGLTRFSCVQVYFQHTLESFIQDTRGVHLSIRMLDNSLVPIECAYLLACDGGKSSIRRMLDIPMRLPGERESLWERGSSTPPSQPHGPPLPPSPGRDKSGPYGIQPVHNQGQRWLVVDAVGESEPSDTILFFCNPARPAVSVPGPGTQRRWEFMLLPGESPEDLLDTETIHQLINSACRSLPRGFYPSTAYTLPPLQITRQTIYTFHALLAARFSQGRVFLLGDAAHLMPPFGGQGMNSGLRDAHNLCWKLQQVLQNNINPTVLESYHSERYPHVSQMIQFSSFLGKIVMTTQPPIALLRDLILRSINKLPPARESLSEMRIKPQPRYTQGFLLSNLAHKTSRLVGTFLPQPYVLTQEGQRVLLDSVLGNGFSLIRLYEAGGEEPFMRLIQPIWGKLGIRFIGIKSPQKLTRAYKSRPYTMFGNIVRAAFTPPSKSHEVTFITSALYRPSPHNHIIEITDSDLILTKLLLHRHDPYVLVRPDRYVLAVFTVQHIPQVEQDLQDILFSHLTTP